MERSVFYIAIVVAVIAALAFSCGRGGHYVANFGHYGFAKDDVIEAKAETLPERTYVAGSIHFEAVAARIAVTPENRQDVLITVENPGHVPTPTLSASAGELTIDGHLNGRVHGCGDGAQVEVEGYGDFASADLPLITLHTPKNVQISVSGAGYAEIGPSDTLEFSQFGCGNSDIADVSGALKIDMNGAGEVRAGAAQSLEVDMPGAGSISAGAIREGARIDIAGAGRVALQSLVGDLNADLKGVGRVSVTEGRIGTLQLDMPGSSGFELQSGPVDHLQVDIKGRGDVHLPGPVQTADIDIFGNGEVIIAGDVGDLNADLFGPGTVRAARVTGRLNQDSIGPGKVIVGQ